MSAPYALRALARSALRDVSACLSRRTILQHATKKQIPGVASWRHNRFFSSTSLLANSSTNSNGSSVPASNPSAESNSDEPRMAIAFTCTADGCGERSVRQFTKRSYERGIVIVECSKCDTRHLIADHLGWFKESTQEGKLKTVEDLMREKGEKVRRGSLSVNGVVEYSE